MEQERISHSNPSQRWIPPLHNCIKINCDASFKPNNLFCGIGLVARDCTGRFKGARCIYKPAVDAENAESLAMLEAVKWAKEWHLQEVCFESDSQSIILSMKDKKNSLHWQNRSIINDCNYLLSELVFWDCNYVKRVCNGPADKLAKFARKVRCNRSWYEDPPSLIVQLLEVDMNASEDVNVPVSFI
ncbi:hypothetical protein BVC80_1663g76 [Macleaya cordata]|uniref:RNase H type-1 domain-containing protein n=1 Tax=Macleaya cordata TaxID=56857 RepID=A0A200RBT1_MACCD|nr:hypothetical protein BVC80_1663g76 [Macleaya cordata]